MTEVLFLCPQAEALVLAGQCVRTCTGHTAGIQALVVSLDGQMVLTGSDDGTAKIFHMPTPNAGVP